MEMSEGQASDNQTVEKKVSDNENLKQEGAIDEQKETRSPNKGGYKGKSNNGPRRDYNKDRDGKDNRNRGRGTRNLYETWEKEITVTLDTPLPEIPAEKMSEPNNDDLRKALKDLDKEIDNKRDQINKLKNERSVAIDYDRKMRDEKQGSLKGLFNRQKELSNEIGDLNTEKEIYQKDIDRLMYQKDQVIKGIFGKRLMKARECEEQIEDLSHRQRTEKLTGNEERAILKDLKQLQDSLPLIVEVDNMDDNVRKVKDEKKVIGRKLREKIDEKNTLRDQINAIKEKQKTEAEKEGEKEVKVEKDGVKPLHPLTVKINGVKDGIEKARDSKTALKKAHDESYKAWRDQNDLELKIKWIRKQKEKLKRIKDEEDRHAEYKAEADKRKAEIEEHEKLYGKPKKYQTEIDTCQTLITFLESLKPKTHGGEVVQQVTYNEENVNEMLQAGDWKKEKVHVLKKTEEDWAMPGGLSKKKKNKKSKAKTTPEEHKISLNLDTVNDFDTVKVQPPLYMKEIDATLTKLNEKKTYFTKISDDLNDGKEVVLEGAESKTKKEGEEDSEKLESEPTKKERRAKVNLEDDNMFPDL